MGEIDAYYFLLCKKDSQKQFMETFEDAKKHLGIEDLDSRVSYAINKLMELMDEIDKLLKPQACEFVLNLIRENPNINTRKLTDYFMGKGRLTNALYHAFDDLQESGKIVSESHGKGHPRTWRLRGA